MNKVVMRVHHGCYMYWRPYSQELLGTIHPNAINKKAQRANSSSGGGYPPPAQ